MKKEPESLPISTYPSLYPALSTPEPSVPTLQTSESNSLSELQQQYHLEQQHLWTIQHSYTNPVPPPPHSSNTNSVVSIDPALVGSAPSSLSTNISILHTGPVPTTSMFDQTLPATPKRPPSKRKRTEDEVQYVAKKKKIDPGK